MVKSHRSSQALHHYPNIDSLACKIDPTLHSYSVHANPGSPSHDPFGSQVILSEPDHSGPSSTVGSPITPQVAGSVTPQIVVASPSISSIHYLFPSSDTKSINLSISNTATPRTQEETSTPVTRSQSTAGRQYQRPFLKSLRGSYDRTETDKAVEQRVTDQAFSVPPSRSTTSDFSRSITFGLTSPPRRHTEQPSTDRTANSSDLTSGRHFGSMRIIRRQPSRVDLGGKSSCVGLAVEIDLAPNPNLRRKESQILQDVHERRERKGEIGSRVSPCPLWTLL